VEVLFCQLPHNRINLSGFHNMLNSQFGLITCWQALIERL
jgi:hypothetical protein